MGDFKQLGISISALQEGFSWWKSKNNVFGHEKTPKGQKNIKLFYKKKFYWSNLCHGVVVVPQWTLIFIFFIFFLIFDLDLLCGGLIHLNVLDVQACGHDKVCLNIYFEFFPL